LNARGDAYYWLPIVFTGIICKGKYWRCGRGTVPGSQQHESFLLLELAGSIPEGRVTFDLTKQADGEYHAVLRGGKGVVRAMMLGDPY
jgi:hypothetical protein